MKIYDATNFIGKPATAPLLPIIVSGACFDAIPGSTDRVLNNGTLETLVQSAVQGKFPLVLDFEWGNLDQLVGALELARLYGGKDLVIGAYGFAPDATGPGAQQSLVYPWAAQKWVAAIKAAQPVMELVDLVMPSCYLGDSGGNPATWQQTVTAALLAAKMLWPKKPLVPFVWPYSANGAPPTYAEHPAWWSVLVTMQALADGCAIWTNPGYAWDPDADWFHSAVQFAEDP